MKCRVPGLKIGGTSFIVPDDYVPAVRGCAEYLDDISLLLLQVGPKGEYLLPASDIDELKRIGDGEGLTWNVHLPTDGDYSSDKAAREFTDNLCRGIDRTLPLAPHSWVLHVEADKTPREYMVPPLTEAETERALASLERVRHHLPSPEYLALENIEWHPADYLDGILERMPFSRCFDMGHVWKDGQKPEDLLDRWLPEIRMCHLHGLEKRDHKSLHHMPEDKLDALLHKLWDIRFEPVITLEVFTLDDFLNSHQAMMQSYERYRRLHP